MHVTILSRSAAIYTTRRLAQVARARGHRVRVLDPVQIQLSLGGARPVLFYKRGAFPRTDVVIPRIGRSINQYGLAVVNQLQLLGVPVLNTSAGISVSRDKMRCLQLLAGRGIGVPRTVMASEATGLRDMLKQVGGLPVLVKVLSQTDRTGLMICETVQSLEAALEAVLGLGQDIVVQQYVKGTRARDLRVFVVGGRVAAAIQRRARVGLFTRSLKSGAQFERCALPEACAEAASETARVVGLEVCAVDMLDVRGGPLIFEVNSSPGIREGEDACGADVAGAILTRADEIAATRPLRSAAARGTAGG